MAIPMGSETRGDTTELDGASSSNERRAGTFSRAHPSRAGTELSNFSTAIAEGLRHAACQTIIQLLVNNQLAVVASIAYVVIIAVIILLARSIVDNLCQDLDSLSPASNLPRTVVLQCPCKN